MRQCWSHGGRCARGGRPSCAVNRKAPGLSSMETIDSPGTGMVGLLPPERDIGVLRAPVRSSLALAAMFLLAFFALGRLERIGLAPGAALTGVVGAAFALFLLAGVIAHSRRAPDFYVADRKVTGVFGGLAGAAGLGGLLAIGIIGGGYGSGTDFLASAGGLMLGYIILAGLGPRLRSFGAYTPGDFVAARFGGGLPRIVAGLISLSVSMLVLVAHLKVAGPLIETLLRVTPERALYAAKVLTAMTALPGGMRSFTWTQAIQYFVIALACIVPAAFLVLDSVGADPALVQSF